jgi:hypothetical protein
VLPFDGQHPESLLPPRERARFPSMRVPTSIPVTAW